MFGVRTLEKDFTKLSRRYTGYVTDLRREFHAYPEASGQEVWTSARICGELRELHLPYVKVAGLSVIGILETGRPGKRIAICADFDAMPIREETNLPFRSTILGVMHACGHDAHVAMLFGACRMLLDLRAELSGTIYFCFQNGDGKGIGASKIVEYFHNAGGVDQVFGIHITSQLPVGKMSLPFGTAMRGSAAWSLTIQGTSGRVSMAKDSYTDPIGPACEILRRYAEFEASQRGLPEDEAELKVTPCSIHSGTVYNRTPEDAKILGHIHFCGTNTYQAARNVMQRIANEVAASYGATARLDMPEMMLSVLNNEEDARIVRSVVDEMEGLEMVLGSTHMSLDNFSVFTNIFPGWYCFLGAGNEEEGKNAPHFDCKFDIDETALPIGCEFIVRCACGYLKPHGSDM